LISEPVFHGPITITVKTQIQTNRRTNLYLEANWPEELINEKMPVYYYPPLDANMHEQLRSIEEPAQMWLTEMLRYYHGSSNYLEVQYWLKTAEGKMQLILKCGNHSSLIKMAGEDEEEKAVSHEEIKWTKNTMIFGVNFNCTRTCFKSELYVFVRVRFGNLFFESGLTELPFRRSEKRKNNERDSDSFSKHSKKSSKSKSSKPRTKKNPPTLPTIPSSFTAPSSFVLPSKPAIETMQICNATSCSFSPIKTESSPLAKMMLSENPLPIMIFEQSMTSIPIIAEDMIENDPMMDDANSEPVGTVLNFNDLLNLDCWNVNE